MGMMIGIVLQGTNSRYFPGILSHLMSLTIRILGKTRTVCLLQTTIRLEIPHKPLLLFSMVVVGRVLLQICPTGVLPNNPLRLRLYLSPSPSVMATNQRNHRQPRTMSAQCAAFLSN